MAVLMCAEESLLASVMVPSTRLGKHYGQALVFKSRANRGPATRGHSRGRGMDLAPSPRMRRDVSLKNFHSFTHSSERS